MIENVNVCFEVHIKKIENFNNKKSEFFCLIYFRHCRKKLCQLGVYSNIKSFHQERVLEILCKK